MLVQCETLKNPTVLRSRRDKTVLERWQEVAKTTRYLNWEEQNELLAIVQQRHETSVENQVVNHQRRERTKALERMLISSTRLCLKYAWTYGHRATEVSDYLQEALTEVLECAIDHAPKKHQYFLLKYRIMKRLARFSARTKYPVALTTSVVRTYISGEVYTNLKRKRSATITGLARPIRTDKLTYDILTPQITPNEQLLDNERNGKLMKAMREALSWLKPTELEAIVKHFGLDGNEPKRWNAIAKEMGVGDETMRRYKVRAYEKMKRHPVLIELAEKMIEEMAD